MSVATVSEELNDLPERTARLGVVERVTQILDAFTDAPGHLLLEDITRITGLPRSTAFRILRQLGDQGWVEHSSRGYRLGHRTSMLAASANDHEEIRAAASVPLNDLQLATDAVAHLSVLEGGVVHYLDKVGAAAASTVPSRVGARINATDTVSGMSLLAYLSPERVDSLLSTAPGVRDRSLDLAVLHRDLAMIRQRQGVAVWSGETRATGISSIAAPILGPRGPVAAVSVAARRPLSPGVIAPLVLGAARRISRSLDPEWFDAQRSRSRTPAMRVT